MRAKPAAKVPPPKRDIAKHPVGRRYAAVALHRLLGWKASQVNKKVPKVTKPTLDRWAAEWDEAGDFKAYETRHKKSTVTPQEVTAVAAALAEGGKGQRPTQSLRQLTKAKATPAAKKPRETLRRALNAADVTAQPVKKKLKLEDWEETKREAFGRVEAKKIAANTMFTDSKIFPGELTRDMSLGMAWAQAGSRPEVGVKQHAAYQLHAYAGITRDHGATKLMYTKGTKGATRATRGRPPKGSPPAGFWVGGVNLSEGGVDQFEYRRILDGQGGGLLKAGANLFGRDAHWRFMQDGAPAHSVAPHTTCGKATRAVIAKYAELVEDWPPHSADLNPIEKAWAATEYHLWTNERWNDFNSFKAALERAWKAVVTPAYCRRLCGGVRRTMEVMVGNGGAEVKGWGANAK